MLPNNPMPGGKGGSLKLKSDMSSVGAKPKKGKIVGGVIKHPGRKSGVKKG